MDETDISVSQLEGQDDKAGSPPEERTSLWEGDSGGWARGIILTGLFCVIGALISAATIAIVVPIDEVPEGDGGGSNSSGPPSLPATDPTGVTDPATSTPKMKRKRTPEPPEDAPAFPHNKLLCTTNTKIGPYTILPGDGVCDYLFYDSLSYDDILRLPEVLKKKLPPIIDYAKKVRVTELGMSFSGVDRMLHTTLTSQFIKDNFRVLWQRKIYHFGMLNVHSPDATWENIRRCLATLKVLYKATVQHFSGWRRIYTVLGMAPEYPFDSRIADSLHETPPSLVIFLTHVSFEDRRHEDCRILPTSMTKFPENIPRSAFKYGLSIFEVMSYISEMQDRGINWTAAISFTMRGHFYKPKNISGTGESFLQPFLPCGDFFGLADLEPHLLCKDYNSSFGDEMDKQNVFALNLAWKKMMMFDNDYALTRKLCAAVTEYPQVRFGIAAYDVIYDQGHTCPKFQLAGSPFGRVQTLGLVRGITEDFYGSWDMQNCLGLFGSKAEWKEASEITTTEDDTDVTDDDDYYESDGSALQRAPLQPTSSGTTSGKSAQRRRLLRMAKNHRTMGRSRKRPPSTLHSDLVQN